MIFSRAALVLLSLSGTSQAFIPAKNTGLAPWTRRNNARGKSVCFYRQLKRGYANVDEPLTEPLTVEDLGAKRSIGPSLAKARKYLEDISAEDFILTIQCEVEPTLRSVEAMIRSISSHHSVAGTVGSARQMLDAIDVDSIHRTLSVTIESAVYSASYQVDLIDLEPLGRFFEENASAISPRKNDNPSESSKSTVVDAEVESSGRNIPVSESSSDSDFVVMEDARQLHTALLQTIADSKNAVGVIDVPGMVNSMMTSLYSHIGEFYFQLETIESIIYGGPQAVPYIDTGADTVPQDEDPFTQAYNQACQRLDTLTFDSVRDSIISAMEPISAARVQLDVSNKEATDIVLTAVALAGDETEEASANVVKQLEKNQNQVADAEIVQDAVIETSMDAARAWRDEDLVIDDSDMVLDAVIDAPIDATLVWGDDDVVATGKKERGSGTRVDAAKDATRTWRYKDLTSTDKGENLFFATEPSLVEKYSVRVQDTVKKEVETASNYSADEAIPDINDEAVPLVVMEDTTHVLSDGIRSALDFLESMMLMAQAELEARSAVEEVGRGQEQGATLEFENDVPNAASDEIWSPESSAFEEEDEIICSKIEMEQDSVMIEDVPQAVSEEIFEPIPETERRFVARDDKIAFKNIESRNDFSRSVEGVQPSASQEVPSFPQEMRSTTPHASHPDILDPNIDTLHSLVGMMNSQILQAQQSMQTASNGPHVDSLTDTGVTMISMASRTMNDIRYVIERLSSQLSMSPRKNQRAKPQPVVALAADIISPTRNYAPPAPVVATPVDDGTIELERQLRDMMEVVASTQAALDMTRAEYAAARKENANLDIALAESQAELADANEALDRFESTSDENIYLKAALAESRADLASAKEIAMEARRKYERLAEANDRLVRIIEESSPLGINRNNHKRSIGKRKLTTWKNVWHGNAKVMVDFGLME